MSGLVDVDSLLFDKDNQTSGNASAGAAKQSNSPVLNDSISKLTDNWRNEVHAPEILPYRTDLLDEVIQFLKEQIVRILQIINIACGSIRWTLHRFFPFTCLFVCLL